MLQFISHATAGLSAEEGIRLALEGGCRWIQLRMKGLCDAEVRPVALRVKAMCREAGATLVVDDRVELAREVGADGVHLGRDDMPVAEARRLLGPDYIIGATANTFADIERHCADGASYIGCGPFRFTTTKERLAPLLGLDGYRRITAQMRQHAIALPLVAIGGITRADIPQLMAAGVSGVAVSGAILRAGDPAGETRQIIETINTHTTWKN